MNTNREKLSLRVEKEFKEYKENMLLKTKEEIFNNNYKIRFCVEMHEYFYDIPEILLDDIEIDILISVYGNLLEVLYDFYLKREYASINSWEDITDWVKMFCDKESKHLTI